MELLPLGSQVVSIAILNHHPLNDEIYQDQGVEDLIDAIKGTSQVAELIVNRSALVLSGNRRLKAAKEIGLTELRVHVIDPRPEDEGKLLIELNAQRQKTVADKMREVAHLRQHYDTTQGQRTDLSPEQKEKAKEHFDDMAARVMKISTAEVSKLLTIQRDEDLHYLLPLIDAKQITLTEVYRLAKRMKKPEPAAFNKDLGVIVGDPEKPFGVQVKFLQEGLHDLKVLGHANPEQQSPITMYFFRKEINETPICCPNCGFGWTVPNVGTTDFDELFEIYSREENSNGQ
jgi:hypothetical protein